MEAAKNTVTGSDRDEHWLVAGDVVPVRASGLDTSGNLLIIEVNGRRAG
jgi:hypothetical protein